MNINWSVRFKNVVFILQIVASIFVPILAYFGLRWEDMTSWGALWSVLVDAVQNPVVVVSTIVAIINAIPDPTTKGLSDSEQALTYTVPKG